MVPMINHAGSARAPRVIGLGCLVAAITLVGLLLLDQTPTRSTTATGADQTEDLSQLPQEGQQVYSQFCSSCHQPGGAGLAGQFPPLLNNTNVDDTAYVLDVIENGQTGELEVNGETFDGVMPSFSTLSEREIEAVIAYMQADFVVPAVEDAAGQTDSVAGADEPSSIGRWIIVASLLAVAVGAVVFAPRLLTEHDRLETPWLDAGVKAAAIVIAVALLIVVIPDWALTQGPVTRLSRFAQDLIGTAVWGAGLGLLLFGLWFAHRHSRI